jgi:hypothetical protein
MNELIKILAWPSVVLVIAVIFIFAFRGQIATLINRTRKVGKGWLETLESQPAQPIEEKKGVDEFLRGFDSPMLIEAETLILTDLKERRIDAPVDREKALVRALAGSSIIQQFERIFGAIWGSQVACLIYVNGRSDGVEVSEIAPVYESAKEKYPTWYENQSFERWLGFLKAFNLVLERDSRLFITVAGREFLQYLVASGKSSPVHG